MIERHGQKYSPAAIPRGTIRTARQGDDTVVLRKGRHGRHRAEGREHTVYPISEHAALDTGLVNRPIDLNARDIA